MLNLGSRLRAQLLGYFFANPSASHYLRELARLLSVDPANLSRELAALEREGLFISQNRGHQKYFHLNRRYPLYDEVRRIVSKTVGAVGQFRERLAAVPGIQQAYLYGSFASDQQDASSDIDLLLVGQPGAEELEKMIRSLERRLRREINHIVLSPAEFRARRAAKDAFLKDIWRRPKVNLVAPE